METYIPINKGRDYDTFTDGSKVFVGLLGSDGVALVKEEIADFSDEMRMDAVKTNRLRKKVAVARKAAHEFKEMDVCAIETWHFARCRLMGFGWGYGRIEFTTDRRVEADFFVPDTPELQKLNDRYAYVVAQLGSLFVERDQLTRQLRNHEVKPGHLIKGLKLEEESEGD